MVGNQNLEFVTLECGWNFILTPVNVVRHSLNVFLKSQNDTKCFRDEKVTFLEKVEKSIFLSTFLARNVCKKNGFFNFFQKGYFFVSKTFCIVLRL